MYPDQKVNTFKNFYKTTDTWKMHFHARSISKSSRTKNIQKFKTNTGHRITIIDTVSFS